MHGYFKRSIDSDRFGEKKVVESLYLSIHLEGLFFGTWKSCCSPSENPAHTQDQLTHRDQVLLIFESTEPSTQQMFKKCLLNECINFACPSDYSGLTGSLKCASIPDQPPAGSEDSGSSSGGRDKARETGRSKWPVQEWGSVIDYSYNGSQSGPGLEGFKSRIC